MRVSTGQIFHQNTNSMMQKQSATNNIMEQISSGKKVNTSGDDPIAALGIDNLKQKNALVDQYVKNADYVTNHLSITESKLGSVESVLSFMRETLQRGANGSLSAVERQMVADEMRSGMEELLALANSQDESGNYMFAGDKINTKPFQFNNLGEMVYSGDAGMRKSVVASNITLSANIPGDLAFMSAPNPMGDYSVNYSANQQGSFVVGSAKIASQVSHVADTYEFNFVANGANIDLQVLNSGGGTAATIANFDASNPIIFNGIEVKLSGTPKAGDSFTMKPQDEVSIFDSFNKALTLLELPDGVNGEQGRSQLAQLLNDIDSGQNQVSTARGIAGNSLKGLERILSNHAEEQIVNNGALSKLEDLDYASAITEFEKQQLALNAVSSLFAKVGSLSLFDYI